MTCYQAPMVSYHIKDQVLANSHEQNMMPTLLWTWFAFSYTTELICSTSWFDLLAAVTKLTSTVYQWHLNRLAAALVSSSLFVPFGIYMSMPIVCSCIHGNGVFSAIHGIFGRRWLRWATPGSLLLSMALERWSPLLWLVWFHILMGTLCFRKCFWGDVLMGTTCLWHIFLGQ